MNLGNIFKRDNQSVRMNDPVRVAEPMSKGERLYRMQNEIRNLAPGQTIQGSVVSRDGTSVQVSIGPDMYDIHTPKERISIPSVKRVYEFVLEVLKELH